MEGGKRVMEGLLRVPKSGVGGLERLVPNRDLLLGLLLQVGLLGLRDLGELLVRRVDRGPRRAAELRLVRAQGVVPHLRHVHGLLEVLGRLLACVLGALQGLRRHLDLELLPHEVVLLLRDPHLRGLLLDLGPVEIALVKARGGLAAAVVLALRDAGATLLAAGAVGPALAPALPKGLDERFLFAHHLRSPEPGAHEGRSAGPRRQGEADHGGEHQAGAERHAPVLPHL
mmetsp:Transcript_138046/g.429049  ORF Transcript_138046/g.429049 Transcript_138046/m.429049 type:complete len:229 (+) Transcript_138046:845-1531(+)